MVVRCELAKVVADKVKRAWPKMLPVTRVRRRLHLLATVRHHGTDERRSAASAPGIDSVTNLASSVLSPRGRGIAYWVTTALVIFELVLGGVWDVLRVPQVRGVIDRLGYPSYFLVILGVWKLLGAIALIVPRFPRLKEWAYAGVVFNFTGAIASHLASRFIEAGALVYLIVMTGVTAASWALRPSSRRLGPS